MVVRATGIEEAGGHRLDVALVGSDLIEHRRGHSGQLVPSQESPVEVDEATHTRPLFAGPLDTQAESVDQPMHSLVVVVDPLRSGLDMLSAAQRRVHRAHTTTDAA